MSIVKCENLTKHFGDVKALQGIDLALEPGELLMIVGPSGSGKTTLISVIAGILNQDEGTCLLFDQDILALPPEEKAKFRGKHIGFAFQSFNLVPMLTAKENVAVPLLLAGMEEPEAFSKSAELLKQFGLEDKIDEFPRNLSGGQQQRVAIARSCIHEPGLIVCDEPTSALDHETGAQVMDLFKKEVIDKNRGLIIVTHDARIFDYADRIIKLDDGKIINSSSEGANH